MNNIAFTIKQNDLKLKLAVFGRDSMADRAVEIRLQLKELVNMKLRMEQNNG